MNDDADRQRQLLRALHGVRLAECRDCGQPIRFVLVTRVRGGKSLQRPMPVDPAPHTAGNVIARRIGSRLHGFVLSKEHRPTPLDVFRFMPHHATCPERRSSSSNSPTEAPPALF